MKQTGFSLLETLVATSIVLVMIGAGGTVNRALFVANSKSADQAQASNLAERGFQLLEATQTQLRAQGIGGTNLADLFNLDDGQSLNVIAYSVTSGSNTLSWCYQGAPTCLTEVSSVQPNSTSAAYLMDDFLDDGYETIMVDRKSGTDRGVVDFTTRGAAVVQTDQNYDVYDRRIQISLPAPTDRVVANAAGVFIVKITVRNKVTGYTLERSAIFSDYQSL